jgi:hypothetical protein
LPCEPTPPSAAAAVRRASVKAVVPSTFFFRRRLRCRHSSPSSLLFDDAARRRRHDGQKLLYAAAPIFPPPPPRLLHVVLLPFLRDDGGRISDSTGTRTERAVSKKAAVFTDNDAKGSTTPDDIVVSETGGTASFAQDILQLILQRIVRMDIAPILCTSPPPLHQAEDEE